jgi:hypothetical protein
LCIDEAITSNNGDKKAACRPLLFARDR